MIRLNEGLTTFQNTAKQGHWRDTQGEIENAVLSIIYLKVYTIYTLKQRFSIIEKFSLSK